MALVLGAELLDQLDKVELLIHIGLVGLTQRESPLMGRPRKPPSELTDQEVLRKLFPPPVRKEAKKTAKNAEKKATKKDSR
ncbi:MAG: hypothetical protein ACXVR9_02660 [Gaiellaceae bacterium]